MTSRIQLVRRLALGGMAEVWEGTLDGRRVAVKTMHGHLVEQAQARAMFTHEKRVLQSLRHPAIPSIVDAEIEGTTTSPSFAMDFRTGRGLDDLVRSATPLAWPAWAAVAHALLDALAHVHDARSTRGDPLRVVHRDVCPANVLVDRTGRLSLLDFGVATSAMSGGHAEPGSTRGTSGYLAPESIDRRARVDARADLFSAGVVLWELAVGQRLFEGPPLLSMQATVDTDAPDLLDVRADVPDPIARWMARALERHPQQRWHGAIAARASLSEALAACTLVWDAGALASVAGQSP